MLRTISAIAISAFVVAGTPHSAFADEPAHEQKELHCISLPRIRSTEVIDEQHILFRMTGKDMYLNTLPRRCPGLTSDKAYMYRTSLNQLCDLDIITVLNQAPIGFMPGASCGLGKFLPIDEEGVKELKAAVEERQQGRL